MAHFLGLHQAFALEELVILLCRVRINILGDSFKNLRRRRRHKHGVSWLHNQASFHLRLEELLKVCSHYQEVLYTRNALVDAVKHHNEKLTRYFLSQFMKLIKVHASRMLWEYCFDKFLNLFVVLSNLVKMLNSRSVDSLAKTRAFLHVNWYVFKHHLDFIFWYILVIIYVEDSESDVHLLFERSHKKFQEKGHKFIVVDSFIAVSINLLDESISN